MLLLSITNKCHSGTFMHVKQGLTFFKLPIMAEMQQYLARCFAFLLEIPAKASDRQFVHIKMKTYTGSPDGEWSADVAGILATWLQRPL